jgi:hypothetical protein
VGPPGVPFLETTRDDGDDDGEVASESLPLALTLLDS